MFRRLISNVGSKICLELKTYTHTGSTSTQVSTTLKKLHDRVRSRLVRRGIGFVVDALAISVGVVVGAVVLTGVVEVRGGYRRPSGLQQHCPLCEGRTKEGRW